MATRPAIQVVRAGKDIATADDKDFTVNTLKNQLKILHDVYGTIVIPASPGMYGTMNTVVVNHDLGYKPFVRLWAKGSGDTVWKQSPATLTGITAPDLFCGVTQGDNETDFVFYALLNDPGTPAYSAQTIEYRYVIYIDPSRDAWDS